MRNVKRVTNKVTNKVRIRLMLPHSLILISCSQVTIKAPTMEVVMEVVMAVVTGEGLPRATIHSAFSANLT